MKHAVILAHPSRESFVATLATAYGEAALAHGHEIVLRDLYRMNFDPRLQECEIPWSKSFAIRDDVLAERDLLSNVETFALFYPIWLNAPPAILKGYLERVFGLGFAYRREPGGNSPLLGGRKLISFTSSGAPTEWVIQSGAWQAMRNLFDGHFAAVCGLTLVDHIHFGGVVPGIRSDSVAADIEATQNAFAMHFVR